MREISNFLPTMWKPCVSGLVVLIWFLLLDGIIAIYRYFHYGNELEQFEQYEKLRATSLNASEFFESVDACERATVPEKGFRSYLCRYRLREQREKSMSPLWKRKDGDLKFQVDCKYKLESPTNEAVAGESVVSGSIEDGSLVFVIAQHSCGTELDVFGGSTFEIFLQSSAHQAGCNVVDKFNHNYKVYCPIPTQYRTMNLRTSHKHDFGENILCADLSVTLHYEHFDAFDDIGHSKFSSLHHSIYKGPICAKNSPADVKAIDASSSINKQVQVVHSTSDDPRSDPLWIARPPSSNSKLHYSIFGEGEVVFDWRGMVPKYLTVSAMKRCLRRQTLWFIGESHMRYQFDITMDRYVDKLNMGRYHGSVNVSGVSYTDNTFSTRLISLLDNLPCARDQQPQTLVMQTGSWDLQFFPPRAFIRNPKQGQGVVAALDRLKQRPHCAEAYHVVWMSTMPHPYCSSNNEHCLRLMNYWRNNGGIRAANEFMERALAKLNYPNLVVIDTPSIALPRFPANDIVCVDHFLCNDAPRGFITTPTGIAIGNEVLTYSCSKELNEPGAGVVFQDGLLLRHFNTTTNAYQYYSVEGGCRREFPDVVTLEMMGGIVSEFREVDSAVIQDIPICFRSHFLTRRNGTLYQTYSTKSVFYMDMGLKRQLNGVASMISLGKEFSDVVFVLEKDFDHIPSGPTVHGKEDCNWCKIEGRI